jgi:hypothetical protein
MIQVKYRLYDTFNMKHDNLSRFDSGEQEEYLWREIDRVKKKNLEKNMKRAN